MTKFILTLLCLFPLICWADSYVASTPNKAMIESFDLEAQTINLHGMTYPFAQSVKIFDAQSNSLVFTGLNPGQIVEFKTSTGEINGTDSELNTSENSIIEIRILSDNRKQDEVH